jgi:sugar-specific transcriptional regulator TrmB
VLDFEVLADIGLTQYERQTLVALLKRGVADAATLCEEGEVPTSKIYQATERLERLGLISVQRSRPRQFAAMSPEAVVERVGLIAREHADRISEDSKKLIEAIRDAQGSSKPVSGFADIAMGQIEHVRRHVSLLGSANRAIVSYLEVPDVDALYFARAAGHNILRSVRKNAEARRISHRIVFGFGPRDAPKLIQFLKEFGPELRSATGVRYAGLLGHPFHVIDDEVVILSLDNPFLPERRFSSLMMRSQELATSMAQGFEGLWLKSMKSLQEIDFDPRRPASR